MRAVIQRVSIAEVRVAETTVGEIDRGFLVLLGVAAADTERDAAAIAVKIGGLRVFPDDAGKMNVDLAAVGGAVLLVSQFTLIADVHKGRRSHDRTDRRPEPPAVAASSSGGRYYQHRSMGPTCSYWAVPVEEQRSSHPE